MFDAFTIATDVPNSSNSEIQEGRAAYAGAISSYIFPKIGACMKEPTIKDRVMKRRHQAGIMERRFCRDYWTVTSDF
jgi:hypothetical protein